jgi:hypothetical protein
MRYSEIFSRISSKESIMVQTTFTKQKRHLSMAGSWIDKIRAHEVRNVTYSPEEETLEEKRETYVDYPPEDIAVKVLEIVSDVVSQHGARQNANSRNKGNFDWQGIHAEMTVPQLRALQSAHGVVSDLVSKLPRRNPRLICNTTIDDRPAFAHVREKHEETRTRYVPYEEVSSTQVRTYEEQYKVITHYTQKFEIDYGIDVKIVDTLREMADELGTAIQVAIDEANTKGHENDPVVDEVIREIKDKFVAELPSSPGNIEI